MTADDRSSTPGVTRLRRWVRSAGLVRLRRLKQRRCLHVWTADPPGWKCIWCDAVEAAGAFTEAGVNYEGEGRA